MGEAYLLTTKQYRNFGITIEKMQVALKPYSEWFWIHSKMLLKQSVTTKASMIYFLHEDVKRFLNVVWPEKAAPDELLKGIIDSTYPIISSDDD